VNITRHLALLWLIALTGVEAQITVTNVTGSDALLASRSSNLITNGSFETGVPTTHDTGDLGVLRSAFAAVTVGSPLVGVENTVTPTGWSTAGSTGVNNYSSWSNTSTGQNYYPGTNNGTFHGGNSTNAAVQPDGNYGLYFGNSGVTSVSSGFSVNSDTNGVLGVTGTISNTSVYGSTVVSQSVNLTAGHAYLLDFWTSGEEATTGRFGRDGIFQVQIVGSSTSNFYFSAPSGANVDAIGTASATGTSQRYHVFFTPTVSQAYTFSWTSWGHFNLNGLTTNWNYGNVQTSELVLDDVVLNDVTTPEPSTWGAGVVFLLLVGLKLRNRRRALALI
jgi:hypothetical protein